MAHFAKIGKGRKVEKVIVISNNDAPNEQAGVDFIHNLYQEKDLWKQTSYNTHGGVHKLGGTPFRKNYATVGGTYDQTRDAFIPPKPFNSWILNETTCRWEAPVAYPTDGQEYSWNESTNNWVLLD